MTHPTTIPVQKLECSSSPFQCLFSSLTQIYVVRFFCLPSLPPSQDILPIFPPSLPDTGMEHRTFSLSSDAAQDAKEDLFLPLLPPPPFLLGWGPEGENVVFAGKVGEGQAKK